MTRLALVRGSLALCLALVLPWAPRARATVDAVDEDEANAPPPKSAKPAAREPPPAEEAPGEAEPAPEDERAAPEPPPPRKEARRKVEAPALPAARQQEQGKNGQQQVPAAASGPPPATAPATPSLAAAAPDGGVGAEAQPAQPDKGPIQLPKGSFEDLLAAFHARRQALVDQNAAQVQAQSRGLLDLRDTLGFPDLFSTAGALCREAERELRSGLAPRALKSAELAVALAPDLPEAHWVYGRAQLSALGFSGLGQVGASLLAGTKAELSEPRYVRAVVGNLAASAVFAALVAGALALALLVTMALRYAMHDFHHLFPKAVSPVQTSLLGAILLAIPWLFRLGPFAALASFALAAWLYLQRNERVAVTLALAAMVGAPFLFGAIARWSALSPLGEDLYTVQHDLDADLALGRLRSVAADPKAPYAVLAALGGYAKRLGRLDEAAKLYRQALAVAPGRADAETNLGNVLFLEGDLAGAKAQYESAIGHDPGLAAAYFDLGQAFNRLLQLDQSQQAQRQALELDRPLIEPHVGTRDLRANHYLIDVPLPWAEVAGAGAADVEAGVRAQAEARLFGPLAGSELPVAAAVGLVLLGLAFAGRRLHPSSQCAKCGRPVCIRCDAGLAGDGLCGQCVNVFIRRAASDPPARIRKEARVRAYQSFRQTTVRVLAVLVGGGGQLASGRPLAGLAVLWIAAFLLLNAFGAGNLLRTPVAGSWLPRLALFGLLFLPVYALSLRDVFVER